MGESASRSIGVFGMPTILSLASTEQTKLVSRHRGERRPDVDGCLDPSLAKDAIELVAQIIRIVVRIPGPRLLIKSAGVGDWIFAETGKEKRKRSKT
jgi:hypothetical protein